MIAQSATVVVLRLPLSLIVVTEYQERDIDQVRHYVALLTRNPNEDTDPIIVTPRGDGYYTIYNGHHRFVSNVIAGRREVLAVIVEEK